MAEQFLHGVEVIEIDDGPRPIQTVRSAVIGIVGTAPDSQELTDATLATGIVASNNAITWTPTLHGAEGNRISVTIKNPNGNNKTLSVVVTNERNITVNLATSNLGAITTTATLLLAAIAANAEAHALVTVASTGGSTGAGLVTALAQTFLAGGQDEAFPLNTPVLVAGSRIEAAKLGTTGTLPAAMDSIFDQSGAVVIVIRVAEGNDAAATLANVLGGVNSVTGNYEGVHALRGAESVVGFAPRILIAPGFTHQRVSTANAVIAELVGIAERLRAVIIADGPDTTDAAAQIHAGDWGTPRVYICDPWVQKVNDDTGALESHPPSPIVAGLICKSDNERGFWWSPSNQTINGIVGTTRPIDFALGDTASRANLLNENKVATIIRQNGYRLWGNRTVSADTKWMFLSVRRTADIINDSLQRAHLWAVDRNITKTYIEDVTEGVNAYLRDLTTLGAILGGRCWADPELNSPSNIAQGKVYFDFDFTPPYPAEHITFRSHMVQDYLTEIF